MLAWLFPSHCFSEQSYWVLFYFFPAFSFLYGMSQRLISPIGRGSRFMVMCHSAHSASSAIEFRVPWCGLRPRGQMMYQAEDMLGLAIAVSSINISAFLELIYHFTITIRFCKWWSIIARYSSKYRPCLSPSNIYCMSHFIRRIFSASLMIELAKVSFKQNYHAQDRSQNNKAQQLLSLSCWAPS